MHRSLRYYLRQFIAITRVERICFDDKLAGIFLIALARVAELVDAHGSGPCAHCGHGGSTPPSRTDKKSKCNARNPMEGPSVFVFGAVLRGSPPSKICRLVPSCQPTCIRTNNARIHKRLAYIQQLSVIWDILRVDHVSNVEDQTRARTFNDIEYRVATCSDLSVPGASEL